MTDRKNPLVHFVGSIPLPDSETVGHQFGDYIKMQAKADHDQLLYAIVDRAVRKYGTKPTGGGSQ